MSRWVEWGVKPFGRSEPNEKPYHKIFYLTRFPDVGEDVKLFKTILEAEAYVKRLVERGESNGAIY